jgi:flagellar biogenesis protein FliO
MKTLDSLIFIMPSLVGALYFIVAVCYMFKKDFAWALVWI